MAINDTTFDSPVQRPRNDLSFPRGGSLLRHGDTAVQCAGEERTRTATG